MASKNGSRSDTGINDKIFAQNVSETSRNRIFSKVPQFLQENELVAWKKIEQENGVK